MRKFSVSAAAAVAVAVAVEAAVEAATLAKRMLSEVPCMVVDSRGGHDLFAFICT